MPVLGKMLNKQMSERCRSITIKTSVTAHLHVHVCVSVSTYSKLVTGNTLMELKFTQPILKCSSLPSFSSGYVLAALVQACRWPCCFLKCIEQYCLTLACYIPGKFGEDTDPCTGRGPIGPYLWGAFFTSDSTGDERHH